MQFKGGYHYPHLVFVLLKLFAVLVPLFVRWWIGLTLAKTTALILNLEGLVLMASAFTPQGLVPPSSGFVQKIRWFFVKQDSTPVLFNQPSFYIGLLLLFVVAIVNSLW